MYPFYGHLRLKNDTFPFFVVNETMKAIFLFGPVSAAGIGISLRHCCRVPTFCLWSSDLIFKLQSKRRHGEQMMGSHETQTCILQVVYLLCFTTDTCLQIKHAAPPSSIPLLSLSRTFCTASPQLPELLSLYFPYFCTKTARVLLGQAVCDREKSIYHRCLTEMELERKRGRQYSFYRLLIVYICCY